jgi:hypothetical protein
MRRLPFVGSLSCARRIPARLPGDHCDAGHEKCLYPPRPPGRRPRRRRSWRARPSSPPRSPRSPGFPQSPVECRVGFGDLIAAGWITLTGDYPGTEPEIRALPSRWLPCLSRAPGFPDPRAGQLWSQVGFSMSSPVPSLPRPFERRRSRSPMGFWSRSMRRRMERFA